MTGKRIKSISGLTKTSLDKGENERVDFKRAPEGISAEDFVSFANSDAGGSIISGIREGSGAGGVQIGIVMGCNVDDATILQITNKALSCIPPVAIIIHVENLGVKPFLRIDIPSSQTKPHCTPKGIYSRRDGSRNRALHPSELLKIFVESESRAFAKKFEAAASRITKDIAGLELSLDRSIRSMGDQLGWAEHKLDDTESTIDTILAYAKGINDQAAEISTRLRVLFRQDDRQDPIRAKIRKEVLDKAIEQLSQNTDLLNQIAEGRPVTLTADGKAAIELTEDDLRAVLSEAVAVVSGEQRPPDRN